ncbi:uncharacterized protein LOC131957458 isoform X3 [Physella acuta]|uniref:uncharacterized protein LOC131957458 isoform X3 n=1 Tax=Physella acuta TaxID=109671 RepID=UPI0027DB0843|nr:uncharacterized protein LOC131957458 isoform X3 [Physella acuta]
MLSVVKTGKPNLILALCLGIALLQCGTVMHIVAMANDYFLQILHQDAKSVITRLGNNQSDINKSDLEIHLGIWRLCVGAVKSYNDSTCYMLGSDVSESSAQPKTVRSPCVLILSSDIVLAAQSSIDFYANLDVYNINNIYFQRAANAAQRAREIQEYDSVLEFAWCFGLDVAAGSLSILAGPIFFFIAAKIIKTEKEQPIKISRQTTGVNYLTKGESVSKF